MIKARLRFRDGDLSDGEILQSKYLTFYVLPEVGHEIVWMGYIWKVESIIHDFVHDEHVIFIFITKPKEY